MRTRAIACGFLTATILATLFPLSANAATVTITGGGFADLASLATDFDPPHVNTDPSNPMVDVTQSISNTGGSARSTFNLSNDAFLVEFEHSRSTQGYAESNGQTGGLFFRIDPDLPGGNLTYTIAGEYAAVDANPGGVSLEVRLEDMELPGSLDDRSLFYSLQTSYDQVNAAFTVGGSAGDFKNKSLGSISGSLQAGHIYHLFYDAFITADGAESMDATASGRVLLTFGDDSLLTTSTPPATPLPPAAASGLGLLAAAGTWQFWRLARLRRKPLFR